MTKRRLVEFRVNVDRDIGTTLRGLPAPDSVRKGFLGGTTYKWKLKEPSWEFIPILREYLEPLE